MKSVTKNGREVSRELVAIHSRDDDGVAVWLQRRGLELGTVSLELCLHGEGVLLASSF